MLSLIRVQLNFFAALSTPMKTQFRTILKSNSQNLTDMKTKNLFTVAAISAGLAFGVTAQAKEEKHEEQTSTVLTSLQQYSKLPRPKLKAEGLSAGKKRAQTSKLSSRRMASRLALKWMPMEKC